MKKKVVALLISSVVAASMLTACGQQQQAAPAAAPATEAAAEVEEDTEYYEEEDTEYDEEVAEEVAEEVVEEAAAEEGFSLLDVSEDMVDIGVYGTDAEGLELVFSMFTGPDGNDYAALFVLDSEGGVGDVTCGTYDANVELDENGNTWNYLTVHDVYTGGDLQLGVAENGETGEVAFFNPSGDVVEGTYLDPSETINYMGSAAALLSVVEPVQ